MRRHSLTHNLTSSLELQDLTCPPAVLSGPSLMPLQRIQAASCVFPTSLISNKVVEEIGESTVDETEINSNCDSGCSSLLIGSSMKDRLRLHMLDSASSRIGIEEEKEEEDLDLNVEDEEEDVEQELMSSNASFRGHSCCSSGDEETITGRRTGKRFRVSFSL